MLDDLVIIVGQGYGGQEEIARALNEAGYQTEKTTNCIWPRDDYVLHNGVYTKSCNPNGSYNCLGEGGNFRFGDGFLLFSDYSAQLEFMDENEALDELKKTFPGVRPYLAPTAHPELRVECEHIDLFTLICPQQKLLFLDWANEIAVRKRAYSEIAEREELRVIHYDNNEVPLPLNAAILPGEEEVVVVNRKCAPLMKILREQGATVIPVDLPTVSNPKGGANCQLNHYFKSDCVTMQDLLREG